VCQKRPKEAKTKAQICMRAKARKARAHVIQSTSTFNTLHPRAQSARSKSKGHAIKYNMNIIRTAIVPCYRRFARSSAAVASNAPSSIKRDSKFVARTFATRDNDDNYDYGEPSSSSNSTADGKRGRRVWRAIQDTDDEWTNILNSKNDSIAYLTADGTSSAVEIQHWNMAVDDVDDRRLVNESLSRICEQVRIKLFHLFIIKSYHV